MRMQFWKLCVLLSPGFVLVGVESAAQTSYYRCTDEYGKPVFSQRPCGDDARQETVSPQQRQAGSPQEQSKPTEPAPAAAVPQPKSDASSGWDKIEASNRLREIRREISRLEGITDSLEAERDAKIAALDRRRGYAANNLAGATFLESLASEKQGIISQYESRISSAFRDIERLYREADRLRRKHDL